MTTPKEEKEAWKQTVDFLRFMDELWDFKNRIKSKGRPQKSRKLGRLKEDHPDILIEIENELGMSFTKFWYKERPCIEDWNKNNCLTYYKEMPIIEYKKIEDEKKNETKN